MSEIREVLRLFLGELGSTLYAAHVRFDPCLCLWSNSAIFEGENDAALVGIYRPSYSVGMETFRHICS